MRAGDDLGQNRRVSGAMLGVQVLFQFQSAFPPRLGSEEVLTVSAQLTAPERVIAKNVMVGMSEADGPDMCFSGIEHLDAVEMRHLSIYRLRGPVA